MLFYFTGAIYFSFHLIQLYQILRVPLRWNSHWNQEDFCLEQCKYLSAPALHISSYISRLSANLDIPGWFSSPELANKKKEGGKELIKLSYVP